jgi:hypothetical protein
MTPYSTTILWVAIGLVVLVGLSYLAFRRRASQLPPLQPANDDVVPVDPARAVFAAADGEPPTEDQIAQARLGGPRGAPQLGAAPLVPNEREQIPHPIDDGHTA